jgi:hypothetical protein
MSDSCRGRRGAGCAVRAELGRIVMLGLLVTLGLTSWCRGDELLEAGRELYQLHCARCHGAGGEGVEDYAPEPLQGSHALADLIRIVEETMPEDDPEACTGDAARHVASYIYQAFYVPRATADQPPPRVELARLTVRQYEQSLADLLGTFLGEAVADDRRGLTARYYNARGFRRDKLVQEREDASVMFDFGQTSPDPERIDAEEFAIQWQGSVIAEDTGDYDFVVVTPNGVRLWVNDMREPLIDAWVVSGDQTEHRGTVRLLGGRVYPLRLDYAKSKEKSASISLRWHPPGLAEQPIPTRNLWPQGSPTSYVVRTPFPPDDSSVGYERGTRVSKAWNEAKTYAAVEVANAVVENLRAVAGLPDDGADRAARIEQFCRRFAERAFRRPLRAEESECFIDQVFRANEDAEVAAKRSVLLVLLSPRFLYLDFSPTAVDDHQVASRLSYALWDSIPDTQLLDAARRGELRTRDQVMAQARRMVAHPRTRAKLRYFLHHWLNNDNIPKLSAMQIDLLVNSLACDWARVATLQFTNSVGQARMKWLEIEESHHDLSHEPDSNEQAQDKLTRINKWYCEQVAYLVQKLSETPEPNGDGSLLDHTLVVWTNELGKGNSHTLNDIPFVLIGNGLGFRMGRSIKYPHVTHNRLWLALADAFGHHLETFGKPELCEGGALPDLA